MTTISEINAFNISDAVKFHKELNPLLWNNKKLDPEVRDQLVLIAEDFVEYLGLSNLKVVDVTVSGSNAAYSYTPHSDIDLHILVDFSQLPDDPVYQELFTAKKTLYNDAHDITVRNIPVELYVQDTNQPVESLGEYSILHDKWIRIPKKRRANFDQAATKIKYEKLGDLVELALSTKDPKRVNDTIALIRRYRKSGLDKTGEFGPENLAYKAVRKQGLVKALYDLKAQLHTEKLSIEEEHALLAKPTLTVSELAEKHGVPRMEIAAQLDKGIKVELEHTDNKSVAREIALDHLLEDPKYYDKLAKIGLEEEISDLRVWKNPSPIALHNLTKKSAHKHMRGLYHDGITYWWDANDAIHAQGAKYLGIPYNYLTRMEAGIDSISDNYSVGGDDEVPPAVIQRYDIENEELHEIGFADVLGKLSASDSEIINNSTISGTIGQTPVRVYKRGQTTLYFFATETDILALVLLNGTYLKAIKNFTDEKGMIYSLLNYIVNLNGQRIDISPDEKFTSEGFNWLLRLARSTHGLKLTISDGSAIDVDTLAKEWNTARQTKKTGPTGLVISELSNNWKTRLIENENSLMPYRIFESSTNVLPSIYPIDQISDGGTLDGYVVDTDREQLSNYLESQGANPTIAKKLAQKYNRICIIKNMWVDEEERNQGLGTDLLSNAIDDAYLNGAEAVLLVSDEGESNEFNLTKWYQGFGFKKIGMAGSDSVMLMTNQINETSGYIPTKKAVLNSSISQVYMCEGIYYSKDMLLEQQLYEDFMNSAKQFLGAKFNDTMANVKGQVSDLINAGIIIKDVAANPELMTNVTSQVRKWTSQLVKDITSSMQEVGQKLNMPQLTAKLVAAWKFISQKVTEFGSSPGWKGFLGSLGIYGFVKFIHVMLSADKLKSLVAGQVLDKLKARLKATLEGGTLDAIVDKVKDLGTTVASNVTMPGFMEIFKTLTLVKQYFLDVLNKVKDKFSSITVAGTPQFSSGVQLEASGYIPSEKEKNDPRFKTALTVDVRPDAIKKNAKAFGFKTSRAGIPPQARADGKISESAIQKLIVQSINGKTFDSELHEVAHLNTLDLHPNVISRMKEALAENSLMESSAHDNNVEQLTRLANSFCAKSMKIGSQYIPVQIDLYKGSLIVYDVFKNSPPSHDAAFGTLIKYDPTENIALVKFNDAVYRYPLIMPLLSLFTTTIFVETAQAYEQLRTMLSLQFNEELPPLGTDDTLNESLMREWQSFLAEDEQQELFPGYDKEHREKRLDNWLQNTHAWDGHKPRVFYHATTKDFDSFNTHGTGFASALGMAFEVERHGSFFAVDPKFAELFIEDPNTGRPKDGGRVIPVYLSVQNPIDLRDNNLYRMLSDPDTVEGFEANGIDLRSIRYIDEYARWELFDGPEGAEFVENLQKLGFDGAIIVESIPNDSNAKSGEVWVVFNPNQVKSVYNRGSFSSDDPNLMRESITEGRSEDLFNQYGGRMMEFDQLPESAKKAVKYYMTAEGDRPNFANELAFGYVNLPIDALRKAVMAAPDNDFDEYQGDWNSYHDDYWHNEKDSEYTDHLKEMWPVILDDGEGILDGWHRLHWYHRNGVDKVPAILLAKKS